MDGIPHRSQSYHFHYSLAHLCLKLHDFHFSCHVAQSLIPIPTFGLHLVVFSLLRQRRPTILTDYVCMLINIDVKCEHVEQITMCGIFSLRDFTAFGRRHCYFGTPWILSAFVRLFRGVLWTWCVCTIDTATYYPILASIVCVCERVCVCVCMCKYFSLY